MITEIAKELNIISVLKTTGLQKNMDATFQQHAKNSTLPRTIKNCRPKGRRNHRRTLKRLLVL
jgi:hypothetical protein